MAVELARRAVKCRAVTGAVLSVLLAGCGGAGTVAGSDDVTVTMSEFEFGSSRTTFTAGTRYRFVLRNAGGVAHEWAVVPRGAVDEQQVLTEVEEDDLPSGATVTAEFTFPRAGEYDFACFVPGHFAAGMKLPVTVVPAGA